MVQFGEGRNAVDRS